MGWTCQQGIGRHKPVSAGVLSMVKDDIQEKTQTTQITWFHKLYLCTSNEHLMVFRQLMSTNAVMSLGLLFLLGQAPGKMFDQIPECNVGCFVCKVQSLCKGLGYHLGDKDGSMKQIGLCCNIRCRNKGKMRGDLNGEARQTHCSSISCARSVPRNARRNKVE